MKARNSSNVRFSFAMTALALGGALAIASCAGNGNKDSGGTGGSTSTAPKGGNTGTGGKSTTPSNTGGTTPDNSSGGTAGGGDGGNTSTGGTSGGGGTTTTSTPPVNTNSITFTKGRANGQATGYGWIALGAWDSASTPTCTPVAGAESREITKASPCPACGGSTKWSTSDSLCISGKIPKVTIGDAGTADYDSNWGVQIGFNAGPVLDSCAVADGGTPAPSPTLKDVNKDKKFTSVTFTTTGTITPAGAAFRGMLHRAGDDEKTSYCANIVSGSPTALIAFNTKCWGEAGTVLLKEEDIPNIDKIGVQVSSDTDYAYSVDNLCLTKVEFTE